MPNVIKNLLEDHRPNHSEFQIENFIIGGQGDAWAKYKQCLREIAGRHEGLLTQKEALELFDLKRCWWYGFGRAAQIKKNQRIRARQAMVAGIAETERELKHFVDLAVELKNHLGKIDDKKRAALEAGSWMQKARMMAGIDLVTGGMPLSRQTIEIILMLPKEKRMLLLDEIKTRPDPLQLLEP